MYAPCHLTQSLHIKSRAVHSLNRQNYKENNNITSSELAFEIHKDINTLKCHSCGYKKFLTFFFVARSIIW